MNKKTCSILLVDDEPDFTESMSFWFKSKGYSVNSVHSGEDALRTIKSKAPDIVFLDILMPNMDGYTVIKLIREFNRILPVIMMSAYEKESNVKKKTNFYGVFGFYNKEEQFQKAEALLKAALKIEENKP
ncbi:MAG: response regulator [Candidatus Omnitrophota bacterium]|jgi:CheY-like chemotaxis protein